MYAKPIVRPLDAAVAASSCVPSIVTDAVELANIPPCHVRYNDGGVHLGPGYSEVAGIGFCFPDTGLVQYAIHFSG